MIIYHITDHALWQEALERGTYRHPSLAAEGFIHCSSEAQLQPTLDRYFAEAKEVVVLGIVDRRVKQSLKWEESTNEELFPHIYGGFEITAVEEQFSYSRGKDGAWERD